MGDWKLVIYNVLKPENTSIELYNLANDTGEENDLASEQPEKVKELLEIINNARTGSVVYTFESPTIIQ